MDIRGHFEGVTVEVSYKEFPEARGAVKVLSSEQNRLGHARSNRTDAGHFFAPN